MLKYASPNQPPSLQDALVALLQTEPIRQSSCYHVFLGPAAASCALAVQPRCFALSEPCLLIGRSDDTEVYYWLILEFWKAVFSAYYAATFRIATVEAEEASICASAYDCQRNYAYLPRALLVFA